MRLSGPRLLGRFTRTLQDSCIYAMENQVRYAFYGGMTDDRTELDNDNCGERIATKTIVDEMQHNNLDTRRKENIIPELHSATPHS